MKLKPDCIRDILLIVEKYATYAMRENSMINR
jgi:hypothetical protein